jgi:hypothetical protein
VESAAAPDARRGDFVYETGRGPPAAREGGRPLASVHEPPMSSSSSPMRVGFFAEHQMGIGTVASARERTGVPS